MSDANDNHYIWNTASQEIYEIWGEATFGRSNVATFFIDEEDMSRVHFKIYDEGEGYHVVDLGSSNGTFYNGFLMEDQEPNALNFGDVISASSDVHFLYFTSSNLNTLTKETLNEAISDELPPEIKDIIVKKSLVFFRMILPEMKLIIEKRNCEIKKVKILDDRREKLKLVDKKNLLIDKKKKELEKLFEAKLAQINLKYAEVEKLREKVLGSFQDPIDKLEKRVQSINTELEKIDTKHFFRVGESGETHTGKSESSESKKDEDPDDDDDGGELELDI
jgi:pSer/pThr/pTyr-binding forkhead associated (FHA) protein